MKRLFLGIIIGICLFFLFLYFGGADYLREFGSKTEDVGRELKQYERGIKESADRAKEIVEKTGKKIKKHIP
ncbi:MAG: hypothetical protein GY721_08315 [Deltaproteobacteria bacterium]|nr:hypothetical protein [Deltaproteobacteria bacterium]